MKILGMEGDYSIYRFGAAQPIPAGVILDPGFINITRTEDELSIVCRSGGLRGAEREEAGWSLWKVQGPLDFGMIGVLSAITAPLALAGVSIFAVSTYDTDYLLWKKEKTASAVRTLRAANFEVEA